MKLTKLFKETIILRPIIIKEELNKMTTSTVEFVGITPNKAFYYYEITPGFSDEEYKVVRKKFPKANMSWNMSWNNKMYYPVIE